MFYYLCKGKRINIAVLTAYTSDARLQSWPLAGIWRTWISGGFPPLAGVSGSLCLNCTNNIIYATPCFPFGSLNSGYLPGRKCLYDQPSIKTLGVESLMSFPMGIISNNLFHLVAKGIQHILYSPTGRGVLEAYIWFTWDLAPCAFSPCWLCFVSFH